MFVVRVLQNDKYLGEPLAQLQKSTMCDDDNIYINISIRLVIVILPSPVSLASSNISEKKPKFLTSFLFM